ncbi:hypothetical protein G9A89_006230 [Geosiphon pyriformis]|nr:hypothetical protein G9A89_006230 [Geosiphon pyriformis]
MNNLISIFTKTKLKNKVCLVRMFTFGLDSGHMNSGVAIAINYSLAKYVYKVSENKLSVLILGLYTGALSVVWFSQTGKINSLITKIVNKSSFVILEGNFNEDGLCKSASFKKCIDLGLVNFLSGSLVLKNPTWENLRSMKKTIDYMLVLANLVNVVMDHIVVDVNEHFDTDY